MIILAIPSDWSVLLNKAGEEALATNTPDVTVLIAELANMLRANIRGADMPVGAKSALLSSISAVPTGLRSGVVSVVAMRPSIYAKFGLYGSVDLALIYDERKQVKNAAYYNRETGVFYRLGDKPNMVRPYNNNYLQKTAEAFMAKHPECTVTVSK